MLRGAGAVGAVGIAAAVGAGAASGVAAAATKPAADNRTAAPAGVEHSAGAVGAPVVVYLRDAASGQLDVFAGTNHSVIIDPDLAARLTRAVR
jgi:hypothetical protein